MDDKQLEKLFHDKEFLKTNSFATAMEKFILFFKENRGLSLAALVVLVVMGLSIPLFKWYRMNTIEDFNTKLYEAQKSLKKEDLYRELIANYKNLTAAQYVRLKLVSELIDHSKKDEALTVIDQGLSGTDKNIFTTLLTLKKLSILKQDKNYALAAQEAARLEQKVMDAFVNNYRMITAELFILAGERENARALYEKIGEFEGVGAGAGELEDFDAALAGQAKDMLLFLDLGIL